MMTLPGLIDMHVHLRDPGQTYKEDFVSGTSAALSGGFTTIIDMPNNVVPITTLSRLKEKIGIAKKKILCDVGFYLGSIGNNINEFKKVNSSERGLVFGLKLFLNPTTGNLLIDEENLEKVYKAWNYDLPILFHAEDEKVDLVIKMVKKYRKRTHVCHVSSKYEMSCVLKAKDEGLPVTCGVTPHHLFLTDHDEKKLDYLARMKPILKTKKDQQFLWKNFSYFDVIESDHAPHTIQEKQSDKPPFGVPGLETTLPLFLKAEHKGRLTMDKILDLCFYNPARIFKIKTDKRTCIEIDLDKKYIIENNFLKTKCGWSPFEGWQVRGKIRKVTLRGKKVYKDDKILVNPGFGKVITP